MGFNALNVVNSGKLLPAVGSFLPIAAGETTMSSGTATATASGLRKLEGITGSVQGATGVGQTVIFTATSDSTATVETIDECGCVAGSSVVMWLAWGTPLA